MQGSLGQRIQGITVADIMDREPVTVPAGMTLLDAQEQFFLRYRWPWFAVVDPAQHFLGVVRESAVDEEIAAGRPALPVVDVLEPDLPVRIGDRRRWSRCSALRASAASGRWSRSTRRRAAGRGHAGPGPPGAAPGAAS